MVYVDRKMKEPPQLRAPQSLPRAQEGPRHAALAVARRSASPCGPFRPHVVLLPRIRSAWPLARVSVCLPCSVSPHALAPSGAGPCRRSRTPPAPHTAPQSLPRVSRAPFRFACQSACRSRAPRSASHDRVSHAAHATHAHAPSLLHMHFTLTGPEVRRHHMLHQRTWPAPFSHLSCSRKSLRQSQGRPSLRSRRQ